jgi:hypothetical protein
LVWCESAGKAASRRATADENHADRRMFPLTTPQSDRYVPVLSRGRARTVTPPVDFPGKAPRKTGDRYVSSISSES